MLIQLQIDNLVLAEHLELEVGPGMTAITGETGAGKSLLLNAMNMVLGERCSSDLVRHGHGKAEVSARFDIQTLNQVSHWLADNDLADPDHPEECLIRRTLTCEGRSRCQINGQNVTLAQLKKLGGCLINIHGQQGHQHLLKKENHLDLLDAFGDHRAQQRELATAFRAWQALQTRLHTARNEHETLSARRQLLEYQVRELDELALQENEYEEIAREHETLSHAGEIRDTLYSLSENVLQGEQGIVDRLQAALSDLHKQPGLETLKQLLEEAKINLDEASTEARHAFEHIEMDPARLENLSERIARCLQIARKHRVEPKDLPLLHRKLGEELAALKEACRDPGEIEKSCQEAFQHYCQLAELLRQQRKQTAKCLEKDIGHQLRALGLSDALHIILEEAKPSTQGMDACDILISMNQGQPSRPLRKVASGGELSRISLCIQVVLAEKMQTPTLVFDEVDSGIGGATGEVVGRLLRKLGERTQLLTVTHLAQVASQAHAHWQVQKEKQDDTTRSIVKALGKESRVNEVARMLGSRTGCEQGIGLAMEMLKLSGRALQ